jgi:hypothetical protein
MLSVDKESVTNDIPLFLLSKTIGVEDLMGLMLAEGLFADG